VVIIGGGPAGLSAALYTAREGRSTVVIEKAAVGGLMATIDKIDNYPGLLGVAGGELAGQMEAQAGRFGVEFRSGEVISVGKRMDSRLRGNDDSSKRCENYNVVEITTDDGVILAKTCVITTGNTYRKLDIIGADRVHYCATCDGPFYKGKKLAVIGGGNSAVQEAMFLSEFATHIDLVVRSKLTASQVLLDDLKRYKGKIDVHLGEPPAEVVIKNNQVTGLELQSGETLLADGVFVFAGSVPSSGSLQTSRIELDDKGYVITDENLMTNIEGIFAAGDIRSGNVKQIAVAVGEGATVAHSIRKYLESGV
jgi:thioredoxin reductase (NADPH)